MFVSSQEAKSDDIVSGTSVLRQTATHLKNVQRTQKTPWNIVAQKGASTAQQSGSTFKRDPKGKAPAQDVMGERPAPIQYQSISEKWKTVPVFSYIGVSKLSCSPCQIWMDCYNDERKVRFYTRGSHGKWYWPWGLPRFDESRLSKCVIDKISHTYYEHCRAKKRTRRASDGSNPARNEVPLVVDQEDWDFATAYMEQTTIGQASN